MSVHMVGFRPFDPTRRATVVCCLVLCSLLFPVPPVRSANSMLCSSPNRKPGNSVYWQKAQETHNYVVGNLLSSSGGYRNKPESAQAYEWYCVSQIYADAAMVSSGDDRYLSYVQNGYAWMSNFWDTNNAGGGCFSTVNLDGTGRGGGKFVDDHSLTGNVYLDCYEVCTGGARSNHLDAAKAAAR